MANDGRILFTNHTNEAVHVYIGPNVKPPQTVSGVWTGIVQPWATSGFAVSGWPLYSVGCVTEGTVNVTGSRFQDCEFVVYDVTPGNAVTIAFKTSPAPEP